MHKSAFQPTSVNSNSLAQMKAYVLDPPFPCVGARSALNTGRAQFGSFGSLGNDEPGQLHALCDALVSFSQAYPEPGEAPVTYMALFDADVGDEDDFERRLWRHLRLLHGIDRLDFDWAPGVSNDPDSSDFSFSIAGRAYFIVGLHPSASRISRRSPVPCLAFNFHDQFQLMRASGKFEKMQRSIRARDVALQGNANPVLKSFGEASEARQYSGRSVNSDWHCPFIPEARHAA
jgi:FPC/CPF motif-containing protein YcgG